MHEETADGVAAKIRETTNQVRFALNQLGAQNAHHDFEHLARALARETVCRNILPATGPVSAGGDQGRDFETFTTYRTGQTQWLAREAGVSDGDSIAFACTLQQSGLEDKILADVATILAKGTPVLHVFYYCEANVPVGKRHALQAAALDKHQVHLELFDGQAIAELLTARDVYWVAQEYLHLPAAALPPAPTRPDWYDEDLARWRERLDPPHTYGDLVDLSGCIRYATFNDDARGDLDFWMDLIGQFLADPGPRSIDQKARYEICVAQLRGLSDLRPVDELVAEYLDEAATSDDHSELGDASVMLNYCSGAWAAGLTDHTAERIVGWNLALQERCVELLAASTRPGRRSFLLETLGWLRAQPDIREARTRDVGDDAEEPERPFDMEALREALKNAPDLDIPLVNREGAFEAWTEMATLLDKAPFFPVEQLAELLTVAAPLLRADPRFDDLVTAVDARVAEVVGGDAAASKARDRAMGYYAAGRLLDALREMHRARLGWLSAEASEGLGLACLMTAEIYQKLGLPLAAKSAAMSAAHLADQDHGSQYARACFKIAETDYHQAAWVSSTVATIRGFEAHLHLAEDPHDYERYHYVNRGFFELSIIRGVARRLGVPYLTFIDSWLANHGLGNFLDELQAELPSPVWWETLPLDELLADVKSQLGRPPFSDGGEVRHIKWLALGARWSVTFANRFEDSIVAERLAAFAQIVAAELAPYDPLLLPTQIRFVVSSTPPDSVLRCEQQSDGTGTTWQVDIPEVSSAEGTPLDDHVQATLAVVFTAIADASLLTQEAFGDVMEQSFKSGLVEKACFGTLYDLTYRSLMTRDFPSEATRFALQPVGSSDLEAIEHPELSAEGLAAGYHLDEAVELVANRYANMLPVIPATLPVLQRSREFLAIVARLKGEGWKDWHVLSAVVHIAQNRRMGPFSAPQSPDDVQALREKLLTPEAIDDPAPVNWFTEDAMRKALQISWPATCNVLGLELAQNPPDFQALESVLAVRFRYWEDDAPHEALFSGDSI